MARNIELNVIFFSDKDFLVKCTPIIFVSFTTLTNMFYVTLKNGVMAAENSPLPS